VANEVLFFLLDFCHFVDYYCIVSDIVVSRDQLLGSQELANAQAKADFLLSEAKTKAATIIEGMIRLH
jgi:hypothetical protein